MIRIVQEAAGDGVYYRWRCDGCGELGGWTLDEDKAKAGGEQHDRETHRR